MTAHRPDPFSTYDPASFFCELAPREGDGGALTLVRERLRAIGLDALRARASAAENELMNLGITFTVYSERDAVDRVMEGGARPGLNLNITPVGQKANSGHGVLYDTIKSL